MRYPTRKPQLAPYPAIHCSTPRTPRPRPTQHRPTQSAADAQVPGDNPKSIHTLLHSRLAPS